ncbi:hypothetical protein RRG08_058651 [Elysia crispata]|uniref:Uncharacterized protein n=1 Tax=Elysia crispata TaxID=231223 RepID=A0AAE0Z0P2_9GAST|nr:hypothetical protein RRG08_058651 [Elysia crispata]
MLIKGAGYMTSQLLMLEEEKVTVTIAGWTQPSGNMAMGQHGTRSIPTRKRCQAEQKRPCFNDSSFLIWNFLIFNVPSGIGHRSDVLPGLVDSALPAKCRLLEIAASNVYVQYKRAAVETDTQELTKCYTSFRVSD